MQDRVGGIEHAAEQLKLLAEDLERQGLRLVVPREEVDDEDAVLLAIAMDAADALLDPLRVPGQVVASRSAPVQWVSETPVNSPDWLARRSWPCSENTRSPLWTTIQTSSQARSGSFSVPDVPPVSSIVVPDAGPLIHLGGAGVLNVLLRMFRRVIVSRAVFDEVVVAGHGQVGAAEVGAATFLEIIDLPPDLTLLATLDRGEATAIPLADEAWSAISLSTI